MEEGEEEREHGVLQRQFHSIVVNVKSILLLRNSRYPILLIRGARPRGSTSPLTFIHPRLGLAPDAFFPPAIPSPYLLPTTEPTILSPAVPPSRREDLVLACSLVRSDNFIELN